MAKRAFDRVLKLDNGNLILCLDTEDLGNKETDYNFADGYVGNNALLKSLSADPKLFFNRQKLVAELGKHSTSVIEDAYKQTLGKLHQESQEFPASWPLAFGKAVDFSLISFALCCLADELSCREATK